MDKMINKTKIVATIQNQISKA